MGTFKTFSVVLFLLLGAAALSAGELTFTGGTDKDPLAYLAGEEMTFTVKLLDDGVPVSGKNLKWTRRGDDGRTQSGEAVSSATEPLVVKTSIDVPGFVWIQVEVLGEDGKPLQGDKHCFNGGAGVRLDEIHGFAEPDDFDEFWARQKRRLAKVPPKVTLTEVDSDADGILCYDVRVDSVGVPVSGYLCLPKDAKEKSLPALLKVQGYGVGSASKETVEGRKSLTLSINTHGIENGREPEFYKNLRETTLAGYGFSAEENADPEKSYWNGVALRVMRALEFLKSRPEWNGKTLAVSGGSQGGFQSLLAAGLDPDVTLCQPWIPWFCDVSGSAENGRTESLFMPPWTPGLGYYDAVNHAKRIRGRVEIVAGLGDYVCPPSGQMVLYNNIPSSTKLTFVQGKTHGYDMKDPPVYILEKKPAKNVILMIGDGMGFNADIAGTYWRFGRVGAQRYHAFPKHLACSTFSVTRGDYSPEKAQGYDPDLFWTDLNGGRAGTEWTRTTDSAAAATAINTAHKTSNGRIGTSVASSPLKTYGQIAAEAGRSVGIVTNCTIPDATPGAVMAHAHSRSDSIDISCEMFLEQPTTVVFGTGHPEYKNGIRIDRPADKLYYGEVGGKYVWDALKRNDGFADALFVEDRADFERLAAALPGSGEPLPERAIGVVKTTDLPPLDGYDDEGGKGVFDGEFGKIDAAQLPTLSAMSVAALNVLAQNENGFYLMIEGGAIDSGGHQMNINRLVLEHEGFSKAVDAVCDWVEKYSGWDETLLVITADHETGQLWGPGTFTDQNGDTQFNDGDVFHQFVPVVNNGKGRLPGVEFGWGNHSNALVPVWIKGAKADLIDSMVRGRDKKAGEFWNFSGDYIDNTDISLFLKKASGLVSFQ